MQSPVLAHLLVLGFGAGAWIAVNGVWMELPLLVNALPEGWSLPSYMTIILSFGNIGPLTISLFQGCCRQRYRQKTAIYSILFMAIVACFCLAFLWDNTTLIGGTQHSLTFFVFWYILSFVDCTSSVTFLPFMNVFQVLFLTTYFIGEGLSSLFPAVMALIQGVGTVEKCVNSTYDGKNVTYPVYYPTNFSVEVYFIFLSVMMVICTLCFILLNCLKPLDRFKRLQNDLPEYRIQHAKTNNFEQNGNSNSDETKQLTDASQTVNTANRQQTITSNEYVYFYVLIFWMNFLTNGVLPSISSYSSLPYGESAYHAALALGNIANPLACTIAYIRPVSSKYGIGILAFIGSLFGVYLFVLAVQSPCPILVSKTIGAALLVISQGFFIGILSYVKLCIAKIYRESGSERCLVWYGATVQLGSLSGAILMFVFVTVMKVFVNGNPCIEQCH